MGLFSKRTVEGEIAVGLVACDGVFVHGALDTQLVCTPGLGGKF